MVDHPLEKFMRIAIEEAEKAKKAGDYAIGAVVIGLGQVDPIYGRAGNLVKISRDPTAHAEVNAIRAATRRLITRHLEDCVLYSTHEPCPMCTSAAIWARMAGIVYGSKLEDMRDYRIRNGNEDYSWRTIEIPCKEVVEKGPHKLFVVEGFMREECKRLFHS